MIVEITIGVLYKEKQNLTYTTTCLEEEVAQLISKIEHMKKYVHMLNNGYNMLDKILDIGDKKVIGLNIKQSSW